MTETIRTMSVWKKEIYMSWIRTKKKILEALFEDGWPGLVERWNLRIKSKKSRKSKERGGNSPNLEDEEKIKQTGMNISC